MPHRRSWGRVEHGMARAAASMNGVRLRLVDLLAKILLVALLVSALVWPDLSGIKGSAELATAYPDTLGDHTLGCAGALLAALVVGQLWHRHRT